ncbi:MAG: DUF5667 domain-containing protein [Candidatus Paceibacterota bacterium]|jgi:hypothetical protein
MTPENFKKGIEELRRSGLTGSEKELMLQKIMEAPLRIPHTQARASFVRTLREAFIGYSSFSYAFAVFAVLLLSGSSVIFAAERSVPGSILYGVKVDVIEPIRGKFVKTPEARAKWEVSKAERRLEEAEKLALGKKLDQPRRAKLEEDFEKNADEVAASILKLREVKASSTDAAAERINEKFDSAISSHKKKLEDIGDNDKTPEREKKEIESLKASIGRKTRSENNRGREKSESKSDADSDSGDKEKRSE